MVEDPELRRLKLKKIKELIDQKERENATPSIDKPLTLTDSNFNDEVAKHRIIVVDFWASWCGPCRMMAPIIESLAKEYAGKIVFGKLNVDENPVTSRKFGIMSIPTLIIFRDGQVSDKIIGAVPKTVLEGRILRSLTP
ncbi:MAG: thioredoxin [Candidatus Bathyarchaeia archaeon]